MSQTPCLHPARFLDTLSCLPHALRATPTTVTVSARMCLSNSTLCRLPCPHPMSCPSARVGGQNREAGTRRGLHPSTHYSLFGTHAVAFTIQPPSQPVIPVFSYSRSGVSASGVIYGDERPRAKPHPIHRVQLSTLCVSSVVLVPLLCCRCRFLDPVSCSVLPVSVSGHRVCISSTVSQIRSSTVYYQVSLYSASVNSAVIIPALYTSFSLSDNDRELPDRGAREHILIFDRFQNSSNLTPYAPRMIGIITISW